MVTWRMDAGRSLAGPFLPQTQLSTPDSRLLGASALRSSKPFGINTYEKRRKHFISLDFNPRRMRTYAILGRNSSGMCTYKKGGWGTPP